MGVRRRYEAQDIGREQMFWTNFELSEKLCPENLEFTLISGKHSIRNSVRREIIRARMLIQYNKSLACSLLIGKITDSGIR